MSDNYRKDPRANTFQGWIVALAIFSKYNEKGIDGRMQTAAEHDVLYLSDKPAPSGEGDGESGYQWDDAVKADAQLLDALGFHWDGDVDCWAKFT